MDELMWRDLMDELSIATNLQTFEQLQTAYSEKHRHYHTSAHISFCLALFGEYGSVALSPAEVELAIWFHDSIYNAMSNDNEVKSADWAARFLKENNCAGDRCNQVRSLIMATLHNTPAIDPDAQLLVDIDLAILGTDDDSYRSFEKNVRREYKWVPGPLFRRERRKILQSFLDRKTIYSTKPIREDYESRARSNIEETLRAM